MIAVETVEAVVLTLCRRQPTTYTVMRDALGGLGARDELVTALDRLLAAREVERVLIGGSTHYRMVKP
jgi:hypothetical protein